MYRRVSVSSSPIHIAEWPVGIYETVGVNTFRDVVEGLLSNGEDLHQLRRVDEGFSCSLLVWACRHGRGDLVEVLLKYGLWIANDQGARAEPTETQQGKGIHHITASALFIAVENKHTKVTAQLTERFVPQQQLFARAYGSDGRIVEETPVIFRATVDNYLEGLRVLMNAGLGRENTSRRKMEDGTWKKVTAFEIAEKRKCRDAIHILKGKAPVTADIPSSTPSFNSTVTVPDTSGDSALTQATSAEDEGLPGQDSAGPAKAASTSTKPPKRKSLLRRALHRLNKRLLEWQGVERSLKSEQRAEVRDWLFNRVGDSESKDYIGNISKFSFEVYLDNIKICDRKRDLHRPFVPQEDRWLPNISLLSLAAKAGRADLVRALLNRGISLKVDWGQIEKENGDQRKIIQRLSALYLAAQNGHEGVIRVLLDHMQEIPPEQLYERKRDFLGNPYFNTSNSAIDIANKNKHPRVAQMIKDHMRPDSAPPAL